YPERWDPLRLFLSRAGGFMARLILFFPFAEFKVVTDPTTGLKATRVDGPFRRLDFTTFANRGFGYKVEMLFRLAEMGARISEVPLQFRTRVSGESKMTQQTPVEILGTALRLRLAEERTKRFVRFCIVGASGFVVNAVLLELFVRAGFVAAIAGKFAFLSSHPTLAFASGTAAWAAAFSIEGSIINNFLWNNFWTFYRRRAREILRTAGRFLAFNLLSVGGIIIQFCTVGIAARLLGNTTEVRQITLILTILFLVLPYNWLAYNKLVWRKKRS
ncbi:MAG TPA: GtrA family protein, partial [Spirochaetia bacterium]|nr:GtrA family protein [Spirochaetia bacterium]